MILPHTVWGTLVASESRRGFTLIEVLAALAIFAIGVLALARLHVAAINGRAAAGMQTEAAALGSLAVERLQLLSPEHADLNPAANPHVRRRFNNRPYNVSWWVTDDAPLTGIRTVRVTVAPDNRLNGRPVTVSTVISE